jgi:hypothetical protein
VKAKKSKASSGKSGPNFFAAHIEKLMLGLVVAAAGYVVYDGISRKGYPADREPTALNQSAGQVLQQISEDHWPAIEAEREVKHNFKGSADIARRPTNADLYSIDVLDPQPGGVLEKRGDPKLLAPEQLVAQCVSGAIAIEVPNETPDPLDAFENAERIKARGGRNPSGNRRPNENTGAADDEDEDKIKPPARRLLSKYDLGAPIGAMAAGMGMGGEGMGGMGMGAMGGMGGEAMGGMGGMGMGSRGSGGMGVGEGAPGTGAGGGLGNDRDRGPKTKIASQGSIFVAATALVQHKQMAEEFERQFKDSGDYNLMRDMPAYLSFEIQRVDVTQDPTRAVQEQEWKTVSDGVKQFALRKNWAIKPPLGRPVPEVIDRNARHPGLTMPIPPLLVKDYRVFCKHPAIDWAWDAKMLVAPSRPRDKPKEGDDDVLPGQGASGMGAAGMGMGGMGMGGMGGDMGMGGKGGDMGMGGMGAEGGMGGSEGGYGMGMGMGGGMEGGYGGGEGMGMGMGMGDMGMGGMGMGSGMGGMGMGGMSAGPQPEFKMLRFYDMLTQLDVGKAFRYRVRLIMRDPNYPERDVKNERDYLPAPQPSSLQPEVFARVSEIRKKDEAAYETDKKARRTMLKTEWSEPSQPVRISARYDAYAGLGYDPAANPRPSAVIAEAAANIVATVTDLANGVTYARNFIDARRGSVLNSGKKEIVEFVVPASRVIKKRELAFASNSLVCDMRGGEELGASNKRDGDPLAASGEVMVLLGDGTVQITNDIDDSFEYRLYTFADEHETAQRSTGSGSMGGMGGEGGEGGMGGMGGSGMGGMGKESGGMGGAGGGRGGRGGGR